MNNILVIHFKQSNLEYNIDDLLNAQKRYGIYKYTLVDNYEILVNLIKDSIRNHLIVIHFHNCFIDNNFLIHKKIQIIVHYYDMTCNVTNKYIKGHLVNNDFLCTQDRYKVCDIVRNIVNCDNNKKFSDMIKICYVPNKNNKTNYDKICLILNNIKKKHRNVTIDIILKTPSTDISNRIKDCHIYIDAFDSNNATKLIKEMILYSSIVLCSLDSKIQQMYMNKYKTSIPVCDTNLDELENELNTLINLGKERIEKMGIDNKELFLSRYDHKLICEEYDDIYTRLTNEIKSKNTYEQNLIKSKDNYMDGIIFEYISGKSCIVNMSNDIINFNHYMIGGNILSDANPYTQVWGCGFSSIKDVLSSCPRIYAVRGKLTKTMLQNYNVNCPEIYGDPLMVLKRYYNPEKQKMYKYGIVYDTDDDLIIKKLMTIKNHNFKLIRNQPLLSLVDELCQCDIILTSLLNGIILGDMYCNKSYYINFDMKEDFMIQDYFTCVSRPYVVITKNEMLNIVKNDRYFEINKSKYNYNMTFDEMAFINSCPFRK